MAYIIDPGHCTNCGRCSMHCPTHAIGGAMGAPVTIDKDKCIECGKCVEVCPLDAMYKESEPWPEPVPHDPITLECDLCVTAVAAAVWWRQGASPGSRGKRSSCSRKCGNAAAAPGSPPPCGCTAASGRRTGAWKTTLTTPWSISWTKPIGSWIPIWFATPSREPVSGSTGSVRWTRTGTANLWRASMSLTARTA